ncbi:MAG: hypothetical protein ACRD0L_15990, partial [Acidimicrobiales bacterium]
MDLLALPDSERAPLEGARELGPAEPGGRVEVTVVVRPRPPPTARPSPSADELGARPLAGRRHLSRDELEA